MESPRAEAAYTRVAFERETGPFIAVDPVYQKEKLRHTGWQLTKALESWAWDGCNGEPAKVEVYARAAQVELFINGKSAGKKKVKKCRANFNITYQNGDCLLYTSPSPRDLSTSRMPSSA